MALSEMLQRHWWILFITGPGLAYIIFVLTRKFSPRAEGKVTGNYSEVMKYIAKSVGFDRFFGPAFLFLGILHLFEGGA